ncbi:MAG: chorismate mutase [Thermoflexales bacterium]|nr:chorismate mutase [Thermoflexales bacterium]
MDLPDLRRRIDLWNDLIVNRLRDRARFPVNATIYRKGAIPIAGRPDTSLLEFALEGLERYHASLGRFSFPDQQPLLSQTLPESPIVRRGTLPSLPVVDLPIRENLMRFYFEFIGALCQPGEDAQTFGEAAYMDAEILLNLFQRVNVGRFVAEVKLRAEPDLRELIDQPAVLRERLTDRVRERAVIDRARAAAERQQLNADLFERVFRWIIDETIAIEVRYLQRIAREGD